MPKVHKNILILTAGIIWTGVGILLIRISYRWFHLLSESQIYYAIISGIIIGAAIAYFGFSNLAAKNIDRINQYSGKVCFWAFQKWQSYILVIFMISLGIFMRKTSFIPKFYLAIIYIAIGFALFSASFKYYLSLFKLRALSTAKK